MSDPLLTERRVNSMPTNHFTWADMDKHIDSKLEPIHKKLDELLTTVKSAVPDGDLEGHRRAHEQWLEERGERKKMWTGVRRSVVEWAAKSLLVALIAGAWFWIKGNIK